MCGICGFVSPSQSISKQTLLDMNSQIIRRGPDGDGAFYDGVAGLAMRRLAIIDLNGGQQPIFNEDRSVCVVFNGEIYNYRALRAQLLAKGHRFSTDSDTEVLVHLYEEHGEQMAGFLDGMFAFALWDLRTRTLVLGRDRLGIKPLFFAQVPQGLLFGSEIKCLLTTALVPRDLDWQALDEYLTYTNVPTPRTIYAGIKQVPPGAILIVAEGQAPRQSSYWAVPTAEMEDRSEAQWIDDCGAAVRRAVESHLVSDVPVGAFLSGGVDSGLVVALMADILGRPVETFTVGFKNAGAAFIDERRYARELARRYQLNYHEVDVEPEIEEIAWEIAQAFDQPFADDSVIPSYYVSKVAGEHVKVAMSGLGGDELFGGYRRHLGLILGEHYRRVPAILRRGVIEPLVRRLPERRDAGDFVDHLKRFVRGSNESAQLRYQDSMATQSWLERKRLYMPEVAQRIDASATEKVITQPFEEGGGLPILQRALRTDLKTYLVDDVLTLSDRLSMWHSLELRVPYLDHHLVEFAARIPARLKIRGMTQKYLLKRVAERWLPKEMIYHRKQGFEAPMGSWLRGPLLPFFDSVVNRRAVEQAGIFRYEEIRRLRDEHVGMRRKHSKTLFCILSFMLWQEGSPLSGASAEQPSRMTPHDSDRLRTA